MFIAVVRLALVTIGGTFPCSSVFSLRCLLFLAEHSLQGSQAIITEEQRLSSSGSWALELGLSTCDSEVELLSNMWYLPRLGKDSYLMNGMLIDSNSATGEASN